MTTKKPQSTKIPRLLLHACCAPCLTSVYEIVKDNYHVTIYWFNPNIFPREEYDKRSSELLRYARDINVSVIIDDDYVNSFNNWTSTMFPFRDKPEGGIRCETCIGNRLDKTAKIAKNSDFDIFSTTLTVSPHKNSKMINDLGQFLSEKYKIPFLATDFKKNDGYLRSVRLSKEFGLYRQNYCGCEVSLKLRDKKKQVTF